MSDAIWNDTAWMVRVPGSTAVVGPVSLDQVRRGLAHEKLDRGAEIAPQGTTEWRNAGAFVSEVMSRHGPPAMTASGTHIAAPSVDMSQYPDRPPPPPYAAQAPLPAPPAKASIRGLFPQAGRGRPPPPPDFRALAQEPASDQPLPSEQLPLPAPPPRSARSSQGGPPPLPKPSHPADPKRHAIPAPVPPKGAARPAAATPVAGGAPFSPSPSARTPELARSEPRSEPQAPPDISPREPAPIEPAPTSTTVPSPFDTARIQAIPSPTAAKTREVPAAKPVGSAPTSEAPTSAAPEASRDATRCARCGSDALLEPVTLGILGGSQVVLHLPDGTRAMVTAAMCGTCGDVRLTAEGARHLYEAMRPKPT